MRSAVGLKCGRLIRDHNPSRAAEKGDGRPRSGTALRDRSRSSSRRLAAADDGYHLDDEHGDHHRFFDIDIDEHRDDDDDDGDDDIDRDDDGQRNAHSPHDSKNHSRSASRQGDSGSRPGAWGERAGADRG